MSFETPGWGIAPPPATSSLAQTKRKRPSGDDAGSSSAPPGASVNLEKLMAAMEREERDSKTEVIARGKEKKDKNDKKSLEGLAGKQQAAGGGPDRGAAGGKKPFEAKKPYERKEDGQAGKGAKKDKKDFKKKDGVEKAPQVLTPKQVKPQKPQQQPKATTVLPDGTEVPKMNKRDARKYKADVAAALAAGLPVPPPPAPKAQAQAQQTAPPPAAAAAVATPSSSDAPMAAVQAQLEAAAAAAPVEVAAVAPPTPKAATPAKANKKQKTDNKKAATAAAAPAAPVAAAAAAEAPKKGGAGPVDENTVVMMPEEDLPARKELLEAGLTPMQAKMKGRLEGARFRWINEQLYTTSSDSALEMMKADPSIFADYHTGFRHQSHSWPQSPLSLLLTSLQKSLDSSSSLIIDLGCGDAELAKTLVPKGYKVLSYDLVGDDWVTEADFCQGIPLPGGGPGGASSEIVDAAVCCLSLMGRNWIGGVREVARVLKEGGIFEVAEITSRMPSVDAFIAMVVSLGFTLFKKDDSNTHFMMLSFKRSGAEPTWSEGGSLEWEDVLKKGEEVLKACVYKKR